MRSQGQAARVATSTRLAWLPLAACALAWLFSLTPLHTRFSDAIDDAMQRAVAQPADLSGLLVLDFDEASLQALQPRLGPWPYGREVHAALLDFLREAGARAVVFDIVFGEPRAGDAALARSLARQPDTVLAAAALVDPLEQPAATPALLEPVSLAQHTGTHMGSSKAGATHWPALTLPVPGMLAAQQRFGSVGVITTPLDADGYLRRLPLLHAVDGRVLPSLALAAVLTAHPAPTPELVREAGELRWGAHRWPLDAQGMARVLWPANATELPVLAANQALAAVLGETDATAVRQAVHGRTVFIGSTALHAGHTMTPQGSLLGAAVWAQAYAALGRGALAQPPPWPAHAALWGLALLPGLLLVSRGRPLAPRDGLAAAAAAAAIVAASLLALRSLHWPLSTLLPLTVVAAGFVLGLLAQVRATTQANQALRARRQLAEAANAAKSEFLAGVSHELRTPLHAVLGMADALAHTPLSSEQQRYVEIFKAAGSTLAELIDDLLDLSRIEAGQLTLQLQAFRVQDVLDAQTALFATKAHAKGLALSLQVDPSVGAAVRGDPRRVAQVLTNLLGNAIKFTQQGGVSIVLAREPGGLLHVQVHDTGIGIEPEKLELIFEPFAQADGNVARHFGGTGLGLTITKRLVGLMGGQTWVESVPGSGSTFHFTADLPAVPLPGAGGPTLPAPAAGPAQPAPAIAADPAPQAAVHILLAEDNEVNVLVVQAMLERTPHTLDVAPHGEAAIELFRTGSYGLVLMDVHMPGIDGHTATRRLRELETAEQREPTAIVALTASAFEADRQASLAAGCNGHLTKPLGRKQLLDAIAAFGKPRQQSRSAAPP